MPAIRGTTSVLALDRAGAYLANGDWEHAQNLAQAACAMASSAGDHHMQARSSALLGRSWLYGSRIGLAGESARTACEAARRADDPDTLAEALCIASYAQSALGFADEALQLACEAVRVAGQTKSERLQAGCLNYHGVVSVWRGEYGIARGVLDDSAALVSKKDVAAAFQPLTNALFAELMRVVDAELADMRLDLTELRKLTSRAIVMADTGAAGTIAQVSAVAGLVFVEFATCFLATRDGRSIDADAAYLACLERATSLPARSWLWAMVWWARAERAWAAEDTLKARESSEGMLMAARAGEHAQVARIARALTKRFAQ